MLASATSIAQLTTSQFLALMALVWDLDDGQVRKAVGGLGVWLVRDVSGGVHEGVLEAIRRLNMGQNDNVDRSSHPLSSSEILMNIPCQREACCNNFSVQCSCECPLTVLHVEYIPLFHHVISDIQIGPPLREDPVYCLLHCNIWATRSTEWFAVSFSSPRLLRHE